MLLGDCVNANVLNLPQYRVLKVDESEHDYHVYTESGGRNALSGLGE